MLSELEKIRSRALSFSSDNGPNDNLEDLNALESVINENDLQPVLKSSPLKASPGGLLKRRRRKHCVHDASDKLQLLALNDNNVFETGSQDENGDGIKRTAEDFPLQQVDLSGQALRKDSKSRVASTRPRKYGFEEIDRKAVMSTVSRLIRERPITLPVANVKRFDDIDEYLSVYRQRKRERENRRKQILSSTKTSSPSENPNCTDRYGDSDVEQSRIDVVPIDVRNGTNTQRNVLLERLEQQIIRERNNNKSLWDKGGRNRLLLKEKLQEQIEKHRQERMAKKAAQEREAAKETQDSDFDRSAYVKSYEPPEISSFAVSDTKTEEAIETAFKAIEALGAHAREPSPSGSFTERWTVESLPANVVDAEGAASRALASFAEKDSSAVSDQITLSNEFVGEFADFEPEHGVITAGKRIGTRKPLESDSQDKQPEKKEEIVLCWDEKAQDRKELVKEWLEEIAPSAGPAEDLNALISDDENEITVRCVSSDDESLQILDTRSEDEEEHGGSSLEPKELTFEERRPILDKIVREYIEDQAELSGSNASEDENENSVDSNVDIIDQEQQDDVEEEDVNAERNKVHIMREIAEDDRRLHALKERYLPKVQPTRQKRFRWNEDDMRSDAAYFPDQHDFSEDETTGSLSQQQLSVAESFVKSDMADVHYDNSVEKLLNNKSFRLVKGVDVAEKYEHPAKGFYKQVVAGFAAVRRSRICKIDDFFRQEKQEESPPEVVDNTGSIFDYL